MTFAWSGIAKEWPKVDAIGQAYREVRRWSPAAHSSRMPCSPGLGMARSDGPSPKLRHLKWLRLD